MPRAGRECAITRHVTNPSSDRFILHNLVWTRWCSWRGACQRKERPRPTRHARDRETTWWRVEILKVKHAAELVWGEKFSFSAWIARATSLSTWLYLGVWSMLGTRLGTRNLEAGGRKRNTDWGYQYEYYTWCARAAAAEPCLVPAG